MKLKLLCPIALAFAASLVVSTPASALERIVTNVYFDWGSTTLNAKAVAAVRAAAPKAKACEYNGMRVVGHADTSHTEEESTALGLARAKAVRAALMKLGLNDSAISVATHGEIDLAKETADGVREPLNRRVEIIVVCD